MPTAADTTPAAPAPPAAPPTPTDPPPPADPPRPADPPTPADPPKPAPPSAPAPSGATPAPGGVIAPTYTLTAPEGSYFDDGVLAGIEAEARLLKLPNTAAQELVTFRAAQAKALRDGGLAEVKADPEIGGTHYDETVALVKAGREWLAPKGSRAEQKLIALVDMTGLGNDVDLVRMFRRIGQSVREDSGGAGGRIPAGAQKTTEELFYPTTPAPSRG